MRFLKNLTFLVFFFFSANVLADTFRTFTVTPTQLNISCLTQYAPPQTGRLVSCDADDSFIPTPVEGTAHCVEPSALPFDSKQLDSEDFTEDYTGEIPPVSLNFPPALIDVNIVWDDLIPLYPEPLVLNFLIEGLSYQDVGKAVGMGTTAKLPFPAMTALIELESLPSNPGECIITPVIVAPTLGGFNFPPAASSSGAPFSTQLSVPIPTGQPTLIASSNPLTPGTVPPDFVLIPDGETACMENKRPGIQKLDPFNRIDVEICDTAGIQGYIDISLAFRPSSPIDYASWNFSGGLLVSASPTDETLQDYVGTIDGGAIVFSSDVDGSLINAEEVGPDTISPAFRYEKDSNPNDNILGWMEIDLSSFSNQQWQPFELEWVLPDGRTRFQDFTNVYAMGLGQLIINSPGSSPLSIKLVVTERGSPPTTMPIQVGPHQVTIQYALYGSSDN